MIREIFSGICVCIYVLSVAPVLAGATPPSVGEDILTGLVKTVANSADTHLEQPDSIQVYWGDMSDASVLDVLTEISSLGALDFVSNVYDSADFYESGFWGYRGDTYHSGVYNGRLPGYDMNDFIRPVSGGTLTSTYGYRESYRRVHKGVDISLNVGDPVYAALPGIVGRIGYEPGGYGHFIILVHSNGVETRYAHLSRVTATLGQEVNAGQGIAFGGNTGNSTGPHLHFEVRRHGRAIDPLSVFEM